MGFVCQRSGGGWSQRRQQTSPATVVFRLVEIMMADDRSKCHIHHSSRFQQLFTRRLKSAAHLAPSLTAHDRLHRN